MAGPVRMFFGVKHAVLCCDADGANLKLVPRIPVCCAKPVSRSGSLKKYDLTVCAGLTAQAVNQ